MTPDLHNFLHDYWSPLNILKPRFRAMSWRWWPGHVTTFLGRFLVRKYPKKANLKGRRYSLVIYFTRFVSMSWSIWCGRTSKSDEKWPSYGHLKFAQKWRPGPFWADNWSFWPYFIRYGSQISFSLHLHWYWGTNQIKS